MFFDDSGFFKGRICSNSTSFATFYASKTAICSNIYSFTTCSLTGIAPSKEEFVAIDEKYVANRADS